MRRRVQGPFDRAMLGPTSRRLVVAAVALTLLAASCGENKSDEQLAREALTRGLQAHRAGDLEEAGEAYRQVQRYSPDSQHAWFNLGLIDQTEGRLQDAEEKYRRALEIDPNFVSALFNLAIVENESGDGKSAERLYRRVIRIDPIYAEAHLNLGFVLRDAGKEKGAEEAFNRAIELDPALERRIPKERNE